MGSDTLTHHQQPRYGFLTILDRVRGKRERGAAEGPCSQLGLNKLVLGIASSFRGSSNSIGAFHHFKEQSTERLPDDGFPRPTTAAHGTVEDVENGSTSAGLINFASTQSRFCSSLFSVLGSCFLSLGTPAPSIISSHMSLVAPHNSIMCATVTIIPLGASTRYLAVKCNQYG